MLAELDRVTRVKRELFIRGLVPASPPAAVARQLVKLMREHSLPAGAVLYDRGAKATEAYFLVDGSVELVGDGDDRWRFEKGAVLGMLDCSIQRPHERRAVALTDVDVLAINAEEWMDVFAENLGYTRIVREELGRMQHRAVLLTAPGGGYGPRELTPEEALEVGVLEGSMVDRVVALRSSLHMETATVQSLFELAARSEIVRAARGERALDPGGAAERMFVVVAGLVEVERAGDPVVRASFGPGDLVLGGVALAGLLNEYSMTARTDALLLSFRASDLDDVIEDHFDLARSMFRGISLDRARVMDAQARLLRRPPSEPAPGTREGPSTSSVS
jgi:CRP-like cAMP-binding protein